MESKRLHRWWLAACLVAVLLANLVGGVSLTVTAVFVVIYLTGVALIRDDGQGQPVAVVDEETVTDQTPTEACEPAIADEPGDAARHDDDAVGREPRCPS